MRTLFFMLIMSACWFRSAAQTTEAKIQEVYADKTQQMVMNYPDLLKTLTDLVQNRVKIVKIPLDEVHEKYLKLSQVALLNKYNPNLQRDAFFDPETFNPLKYDFITSAKTKMVYRVDNTDYLIVIEPQSF